MIPRKAETTTNAAHSVNALPFEKDGEGPPKKKDDGDDKGEEMEGGGLDVSAVVKAIESGEISVKDMDAIIAAIQAQKGAEPEDEQQQPQAAPAAVPGTESMKKNEGEMGVQMAAMAGRVEGLEASIRERDAADTRKDDVAEAMERLADRPLGADLGEKLAKFHKSFGRDAFLAYVDGMAKAVGVLPRDRNGAHFSSQDAKTPASAMKYHEAGSEHVDTAAQFSREWRNLHDLGCTTLSEDRYVELSMSRKGVRLTK